MFVCNGVLSLLVELARVEYLLRRGRGKRKAWKFESAVHGVQALPRKLMTTRASVYDTACGTNE